MKAISIRQPWAHEILRGEKEYEFRTWSTNYRGDLLICSSAAPKIKGTISGHALIVANLSDVIKVTKENHEIFGLPKPYPGEKIFAWRLTDFKTIKPFKVKGKLNFYNVDDSLIEYIDDTKMSEEEADEIYEKYFEPLIYRGKKQK